MPVPLNIFWAGEYLLRHRGWVMTTIAICVLGFEVGEHVPFGRKVVDMHFVRETLLYSICFPFIGYIMLSAIAHSQDARHRTQRSLDVLRSFRLNITNSKDSQELGVILLQFLRMVVPIHAAALFIYDQSRGQYELATQWVTEKDTISWPRPDPVSEKCRLRHLDAGQPKGMGMTCHCSQAGSDSQLQNLYCLALVYQKMPLALIYMLFSPETQPTPNQIEMLTEIAPEMAMEVDRTRLLDSTRRWDQSFEAEQRRMARDLHDTIGHDLAYLRLKLDQFSGENAPVTIGELRHDLDTMRNVADDAYNQLRDTLKTLSPITSVRLDSVLLAHAQEVGKRSGFRLSHHVKGTSTILPPYMQRQIYLIFREAIANISRHSQARKVEVEMAWEENGLGINLQDDGQGFEDGQTAPDGHYGLISMKERTQEVGGRFSISSNTSTGTRVSLWFPIPELSEKTGSA